MRKLVFISFLLFFPVFVCEGFHSLMVVATYIVGNTQFPQFSLVLMVDDFPMLYVHKDESGHIIAKNRGHNKNTGSVPDILILALHQIHNSIRNRAQLLTEGQNSSQRLNIHQKRGGCVLEQDWRMVSSEAFNGEVGEQIYYGNGESYNFESVWQWPKTWTVQAFLSIYVDVWLPVCVDMYKYYLKKERALIMKKVKPRVRLLHKNLPDSGGSLITCLATGFYPRHLNLTLLRDGQPVPEHQMTGGELLPNGDDTYQMRKSLEVSPEELQSHHYTCTAQHLSLDNKLDVGLEFHSGLDSEIASILSSVLVPSVICVSIVTVAIVICRKKHKVAVSSQNSLQMSYSTAPDDEQEEDSENPSEALSQLNEPTVT